MKAEESKENQLHYAKLIDTVVRPESTEIRVDPEGQTSTNFYQSNDLPLFLPDINTPGQGAAKFQPSLNQIQNMYNTPLNVDTKHQFENPPDHVRTTKHVGENGDKMRQTAFFVDSVDHLPSKQLLRQAGFTDLDMKQDAYVVGRFKEKIKKSYK